MGLLSKFFGPPSRDKFARLIVQRLRQAGVAGPLDYDAQSFLLRGESGNLFNLGNAYAEYCRVEKSSREAILTKFIRSWGLLGLEVPEDFEDVMPDLMPVVRARSYFEVGLRRVNPEGDASSYPHQVIAEHLCVTLVYDLPATMMTVTEDLLDKWGVSLYEGLEIAKANLLETTKSYAKLGSLYSMLNGDSYDASRLVLTELISDLEVDGDTIAMVPNREALLIAGAEDQDALATMLKIAAEGVQHERSISGMALRLLDGEWEPWLPDREHHLFNDFNRLRLQTIAQDYALQKEMLEAQLQRERRDVYVASFAAVQKEATSSLQSYAVWSKDVATLLPRTDLLAFVGPGPGETVDQLASGAWEDVERAVGHLMQRQETYPERYLVESFPSSEELSQIGNRELS